MTNARPAVRCGGAVVLLIAALGCGDRRPAPPADEPRPDEKPETVRLFSVFDGFGPNPLYSEPSAALQLVGTSFAADEHGQGRTLAYFGDPQGTLSQNGLLPWSATCAHRRINSGLFAGANTIVAVLTFNTDIAGDELDGLGLHGLESRLRALDDGVGFPDWDLFDAPGVLEP